MYLRTLLVVTLCIGLNSSLCTGGIFAVTAAVADQIFFSQDESGPMSYGSIGILSCKSNTREKSGVVSVDFGGCKNASTCFTQANSILEDRLIPFFAFVSDSIALHSISFEVNRTEPRRTLLARAGPLYEQSTSQVHSLLKLE